MQSKGLLLVSESTVWWLGFLTPPNYPVDEAGRLPWEHHLRQQLSETTYLKKICGLTIGDEIDGPELVLNISDPSSLEPITRSGTFVTADTVNFENNLYAHERETTTRKPP
jgi:hypothetical protein